MFGGGHERGLRPGTLPVHLIAGFGEASVLAMSDCLDREKKCQVVREKAIRSLSAIGGIVNGDLEHAMSHVLNISFPGVDSEAALVALKDHYAISNGSACTSHSYSPSHVLEGMALTDDRIRSALRISWCHMTPEVDWDDMAQRIKMLS
jgi:cysteine desulfurase